MAGVKDWGAGESGFFAAECVPNEKVLESPLPVMESALSNSIEGCAVAEPFGLDSL